MMKKLLLTSLCFALSLSPALADILIIGDSHTAGPFGKMLQANLAKIYPNEMIITYGHSSSAPFHWMSTQTHFLSGGLNHHFNFKGQYHPHPNLPPWRNPAPTQNLLTVLDGPLVHAEWRKQVGVEPQLNTIVIALGANDRSVVSTDSGARTPHFKKRVEIVDQMLSEIQARGLKCIWLGPPASITRSKAKEQTTQEYLMEGIQGRCPLYDSRKFVARHCDQVHFNCPPAIPAATQWAQETAEFVRENR